MVSCRTASPQQQPRLYPDNDVLAAFRAIAERQAKGYQTLINESLRDALTTEPSMHAKTLRRIIREQLRKTGTQGHP